MPNGWNTHMSRYSSSGWPLSFSTRNPSVMAPRSEYTYCVPGLYSSGVLSTICRASSGDDAMRHSSRSAGRPDRCSSSSRMVTLSFSPPVNSGKYFTTGSSSLNRPWSYRIMMAVVVPTTFVREARSYSVSVGETCGLDDFQSMRPNPFSQTTAPLRPTTTAAPGDPPARIPRCTTRSMTRRRAADMPTEAGALTGSPPSPPAMARAASSASTTVDFSSQNDHPNPDPSRDTYRTRSLG